MSTESSRDASRRGAPEILCSHCGAIFSPPEDDHARCPKCLRSSGLVQGEPPTESPSPNPRGLRWAVVAVAAVAAWALWWTNSPSPGDLEPGGDGAASPSSAPVLSTLPEALRLRPGEITGAVQLEADRLPRDGKAILEAVVHAQQQGWLAPRPEDDELAGAPRSASSLAPAISGSRVEAAGPLESAILAAALLRARLEEPISWGVDDSAPDSATDLMKRRYLLRAGQGPWLALDDASVDQATVRVLDEAGLVADTLAIHGLMALMSDDMDLASLASQQARALAPADPAVVYAAGQVQVAAGLVDMGLSTMEGAAHRRADARTWYGLGLAAMHTQKAFKAHQYMQRASQTDPTAIEPYLGLSQLGLERLAVTPKPQQGRVVEEIQAAVDAAAAIDPEAVGIAAIQAQLAVLGGDPARAERLLRAETDRRPQDGLAWLNLAQFLTSTGHADAVLPLLKEAVAAGATGDEIHQTLGAILAESGRLEEAVLALDRALEAEPGSSTLRPQLAQLHHALGRPEAARRLLTAHLEREPADGRSRLLAAQLELDVGQLDQAETHVAQVLAKEPQHPQALLLEVVLALSRGTDPTRELQAAVAAVGGRSDVAQVLLEQGFPTEGEALLRDALANEPEDGLAPVLLVALLVATERAEEAKALRESAMARVPDDGKEALGQQFAMAQQQGEDALAARRAQQAAGEAPSPPEPPDPVP